MRLRDLQGDGMLRDSVISNVLAEVSGARPLGDTKTPAAATFLAPPALFSARFPLTIRVPDTSTVAHTLSIHPHSSSAPLSGPDAGIVGQPVSPDDAGRFT